MISSFPGGLPLLYKSLFILLPAPQAPPELLLRRQTLELLELPAAAPGRVVGSTRTLGDTVQCEAPKIAKLVYNCNNFGLWYL
jgi:hypothetical protein